MTSPIDKLIALAEKHDAKATPDLTPNGRSEGIFIREKASDKHVALFSGTNLVNDSAFYETARTAWPATARALKVAMELFALAPRECTCTAKIICPHCLLKAARAQIDRIAGEVTE